MIGMLGYVSMGVTGNADALLDDEADDAAVPEDVPALLLAMECKDPAFIVSLLLLGTTVDDGDCCVN